MASDSVREIEADIEKTRSRLYDTIDRIQGRLTVSGIVDEVMGAAGVPRYQNGHDFVLGIMRRHPVPIMIAAAGIGFLFYRMNRRNSSAEAIADAEYVEITSLGEGQASGFEPTLPQTRSSVEPFATRASLPTQP
jgi:hypothetical protein